MTEPQPFKKAFFERPTLEVAKDLIGSVLQIENKKAIIIETEAYLGSEDPGSHAYKKTPRSTLMFGEAGVIYIYLTYGMHYCLNFVCEKKGTAGAVLIRGLDYEGLILDGPGKLTRYFDMTKDKYNGKELYRDNSLVKVYPKNPEASFSIETTTRIGLSKGKDLPYRFLLNRS